MDRIRIHFIYDYVDPGSYLAHRLLGRWRSELSRELSLDWTPLELRVPTSKVLDPEEPGWRAMARFLEEEAGQEGVPLHSPGFIPWTRKAHEMAFHAEEEGCFDRIHEAIFQAYFVEGRDIGRVDVLVELAEEVDLDPAEVRTVLGVDRFLPEVERAREGLLSRGVRGVPTLEAGERILEGFPDAEGFRAFLRTLTDDEAVPPTTDED